MYLLLIYFTIIGFLFVLCRNEREGIPANLLQMLDVCVEIPQQGVIRSLNVHVSAALLIWEYTRQRLTSDSTKVGNKREWAAFTERLSTDEHIEAFVKILGYFDISARSRHFDSAAKSFCDLNVPSKFLLYVALLTNIECNTIVIFLLFLLEF